MFFPECEIYAETEIGSGMIDGNELFGIFGGKIVCQFQGTESPAMTGINLVFPIT